MSGNPSALDDLRAFLDACPSPHHVVAEAARRLSGVEGMARVDPRSIDPWPNQGWIARDGALVAWRAPRGAEASSGFAIVGAHTDSPGLRVKPRAVRRGPGNWEQLAVEIYGGALLNSWLDRDLGLAGAVSLADGRSELVAIDRPLCRVPQLAIHLDREVNERGLVLDRHAHLSPVWSTSAVGLEELLAAQLGVGAAQIAAFDLGLYDLTPARVLGADASLLAAGRLDNQLSCWAGLDALGTTTLPDAGRTAVVALFDHEEVGSASTTGAAGPLLEHVLERIVAARGGGREAFLAALAASECISADNAHALHPNYADRHDAAHAPLVNHGPAVKLNVNQRYATSPAAAAALAAVFAGAGIATQTFVSRNNVPCGSTIGPLTATRLGITTVDIGIPQLSMHSARELCGVEDPPALARGLRAWFAHTP